MTLNTPTILLVEDDKLLQDVGTAILSRAGFTVRTASDGLDALADLRLSTPGLIVSDLNMPRMSGFEFLSIVRRRYPGIPVIATSAAYTGREVPVGIAADAFHPKGTGVADLLDLIARLTDPGCSFVTLRSQAPIWIGCYQSSFRGVARPLITCPQCLRTHTHVLTERALVPIDIHCISCGIPTSYAFFNAEYDPAPMPFLSWWRGPPFVALLRK